jgi:uncharacterized membrane protein YqjE
MATNRLPETESEGVGQLVKGIVQDMEKLAQQHIALFKKDIKHDLEKLKQGAFSLGIGLGVTLIGGLLLGLALSNLILLLFPDPADRWRWAAYGIVGILITGAGGFMLYLGGKEVEQATPVAEKTMEALEDDVKWLNQPK